MNKYLKIIWLCLLLVLFYTSCNITHRPELPTFSKQDFIGKWHAEANEQEFWVFQDDGWGKTWDESEDVLEEDLEEHGNGWFTWSLEGTKLVLIHQMENGGADIPKTYIVVSITPNMMTLRDYVTNTVIRYLK